MEIEKGDQKERKRDTKRVKKDARKGENQAAQI